MSNKIFSRRNEQRKLEMKIYCQWCHSDTRIYKEDMTDHTQSQGLHKMSPPIRFKRFEQILQGVQQLNV